MRKIDLHLHSLISKNIGDTIGWISLESTINKIKNASIECVSFTDHDQFSYSFFNDLTTMIKNKNLNIIPFPGTEITVSRTNGKRAHVLFIFDNKTPNELLIKLETIINKNRLLNPSGCKISKFIEKIQNYNFFIIPHVDKSDSVIFEDVREIKNYIYNIECSKKSSEYKKFLKDSAEMPLNAVKFSDCHSWIDLQFKWTGCYVEQNINFDTLKTGMKMKGENT
ncbi:MAG: hypothetical protein Ta2E_07290 [Mycoplasmoidaceae bacterium]|nr:MAG: hypothetical protein Ta2E_07290 [Mycoplasmoidaceae bacterium]